MDNQTLANAKSLLGTVLSSSCGHSTRKEAEQLLERMLEQDDELKNELLRLASVLMFPDLELATPTRVGHVGDIMKEVEMSRGH